MRKIILFIFLMFFSSIAIVYGADYVTSNYNLVCPEEGTLDWTSKISDDLISIDSILSTLSGDTNGVNSAMEIDTTENTINLNYRLTGIQISADVITCDVISIDSLIFHLRSTSPDTPATDKGIMYMSEDGVIRFWSNSGGWHRILY